MCRLRQGRGCGDGRRHLYRTRRLDGRCDPIGPASDGGGSGRPPERPRLSPGSLGLRPAFIAARLTNQPCQPLVEPRTVASSRVSALSAPIGPSPCPSIVSPHGPPAHARQRSDPDCTAWRVRPSIRHSGGSAAEAVIHARLRPDCSSRSVDIAEKCMAAGAGRSPRTRRRAIGRMPPRDSLIRPRTNPRSHDHGTDEP